MAGGFRRQTDEELSTTAPDDEVVVEDLGRTYIGVPDDYLPQSRVDAAAGFGPGAEAYARSTLYKAGDEYKPLNTPGVIPQLQMAMINSYILDPEAVRFGDWDDATITAYRNVLETANRNGMTAMQAIRYMGSNPSIADLAKAARKSGAGSGRTVVLANPQDLQAVANEVAPKTIGRKLTQAELDQFVSSFHGAQGRGEPPQMDVAAEALAREVDPTAATARDKVGVFDIALRMMSGGRSGVQ